MPSLGLGLGLQRRGKKGAAAAPPDQTRYLFAGTRVYPSILKSTPDDTQLSRHCQVTSTTPDYVVRDMRLVFTWWYLDNSGTLAQEFDIANGGTIRAAVKIGSTFYAVTFNGGSSSAVIADGGVLISDPMTNLGDVPARTQMTIITIDTVTTTQFRPGGMPRQNQNSETVLNAATADLTKLTAGSINTGNNGGTNNATVYGPTTIIARGWDGRPVVAWFGDSMSFPANDVSSFCPSSGVQGWLGRGMDDNSSGTLRYAHANFGLSGSRATECSTRNAGAFRRRAELFDAIKALNTGSLPPFTTIVSEHINNDTGATAGNTVVGLLAALQTWWDFLHTEFPSARLLQTAAMPNAQSVGNYRWTDSTQMTTTGPNTRGGLSSNMRWGASDSFVASPPAPLYGVINQAPGICAGPSNDRWATPGFSALVTTANTAAGVTISMDAAPTVGMSLVFEPNNANFNGPIQVSAVTGSGPYNVTMFSGLANVHAIGSAVVGTMTLDGVHGSTATHRDVLAPYITAAKLAGKFL